MLLVVVWVDGLYHWVEPLGVAVYGTPLACILGGIGAVTVDCLVWRRRRDLLGLVRSTLVFLVAAASELVMLGAVFEHTISVCP